MSAKLVVISPTCIYRPRFIGQVGKLRLPMKDGAAVGQADAVLG